MCGSSTRITSAPLPAKQREDSFLNDLMGLPSEDTEKDEFESYAHSDPTPIPDPKTFNPIIGGITQNQPFRRCIFMLSILLQYLRCPQNVKESLAAPRS